MVAESSGTAQPFFRLSAPSAVYQQKLVVEIVQKWINILWQCADFDRDYARFACPEPFPVIYCT
jgi:hypothetical protein